MSLLRCAAAGAIVTACLPPPASTPAAPPSDERSSPPDPCQGHTFQGACEGDVLRYCSYGALIEVDCAAVDDEVAFTCALIDASYGSDCAVPLGSPCLDEVHGPAFCAAEGGACVRGPGGAACAGDYPRCTPLDERACLDGRLIVECNAVQPFVLDCPAFGASCGEGACEGLGEGSSCDPALLRCGAGLACDEGRCAVAGEPEADAGPLPDAGDGEPEADAGPLPDAG
ncbi:MAG: hypothetical protein A2138_21070 [Deltaproteobacteria bacterium RBG_16_71_12]|nr:MAG: hypothetical protein A2138_21070 [Deltaproteobacteria bacterium RBG_16_71_12]